MEIEEKSLRIEYLKTFVNEARENSKSRQNYNNMIATLLVVSHYFIFSNIDKTDFKYVLLFISLCIFNVIIAFVWISLINAHTLKNKGHFTVIKQEEKEIFGKSIHKKSDQISKEENNGKSVRHYEYEKIVPCVFLVFDIIIGLCYILHKYNIIL